MSHTSAPASVPESPTARRQRLSPLVVVVIAAGALVTAAALAVVLLLPGQGSSAGPSAALVGPPRDEVATMRAELKLLRRQVQSMAQQQGKALHQAGSEAAALLPLTEQEVSVRDRQRFESLAHKLAAEPLDRQWAPTAERLISDTMKKPVFKGSKLVEATCRTTLCRFEVSHDTDADRSRFGNVLPTRLPSMPSGSMRHAEGPGRRTIIYVAREGHRVPRDERQ